MHLAFGQTYEEFHRRELEEIARRGVGVLNRLQGFSTVAAPCQKQKKMSPAAVAYRASPPERPRTSARDSDPPVLVLECMPT